MSCSPTRIVPSCTASRPPISASSVLLPAPERPMIATRLPASMRSERSRSTTSESLPRPYRTVISETSMSVPVIVAARYRSLPARWPRAGGAAVHGARRDPDGHGHPDDPPDGEDRGGVVERLDGRIVRHGVVAVAAPGGPADEGHHAGGDQARLHRNAPGTW